MKYFLALLIFSSQVYAVDTGTGVDGVCNVTGGADTQITSARKTYQCTTLNIDANLSDFSGASAGAGGAIVTIKVQGNVTVAAGVTLDLNGQNGTNGGTATGRTGGAAGAGGFAGGNSALAADGSLGGGTGGGQRGKYIVPSTAGFRSYGGGGGGGSYKTQGTDAGADGDDGGSVPGSGGSNGTIHGNEANFDTTFVGGSGGAGGGAAEDFGTLISGSSGGGGGGAIHIIAGGNITIDGTITSKGGNGGGDNTITSSGGGGGGSGGAIWLQAGGSITVSTTGVVTALGGNKGENDSGSIGFGGDGGNGRIRLDDSDGVIAIQAGGTVTPSAYSTSFSPTTTTSGTSGMHEYKSSVSCASVELDNQKSFLVNIILGLMLATSGHYFLSRKSKV